MLIGFLNLSGFTASWQLSKLIKKKAGTDRNNLSASVKKLQLRENQVSCLKSLCKNRIRVMSHFIHNSLARKWVHFTIFLNICTSQQEFKSQTWTFLFKLSFLLMPFAVWTRADQVGRRIYSKLTTGVSVSVFVCLSFLQIHFMMGWLQPPVTFKSLLVRQ